MEIENYNNIDYLNVCHPCNDNNDSLDQLCDSMNDCNIDNNQLTIYISTILEKLTKEMIYEKKYDTEKALYYIDIIPPIWFNTLEEKYKNILISLLKPVLQELIK